MIKHSLIQGFRNSTVGNNDKDASRVLKNDLVTDMNYEADSERLQIITSVISEDLYNQYSCKLDIDKKSKDVLFTHCTCNDFEKKSINKSNYCCKHIVASFFKFLNVLDEDPSVKDELGLNLKKIELVKSTENSILDLLINKDNRESEIKFEIIINKIAWTQKLSVEFRIGYSHMKSNKLYTLKDIDGFLLALYNKIPIPYGKDFTFDIKQQKINSKCKRLINLIEMIKEIDNSSNSYRKVNERLINGKQIIIPKFLLKEFLKIAKNFRVYLGTGFYSRLIETEIIEDKLPVNLTLREVGDMIKLDASEGLPEMLGENEEVFIYNTDIYLPPYEQIEGLLPYIEAFNHGNTVFFSKEEEDRILKELIPSMQKISNNLVLSKNIKDKIVISPVKFKFYFDKDNEITLTLKVCYDKYEFNYFYEFDEKVIYRDKNKEDQILLELRKLGFEPIENKFYYLKSEESIFDFFKFEINKLQEFGEVFYSERFTGIKNITANSFKGQIKKGKYDYFDFKISIKDIDDSEYVNILRAFRDKKKYYRLENGEFLDLEEIELNKFLKLLDTIEDGNIDNNIIKVNKNKGLYVEEYIEENGINYFTGRNNLRELKKSLKNIKNKDFILPTNINANLRTYQKEGYYWMKSLDYLGFGGILGDEMGLGKTLQTITFLASNPESKSLIIAPTSLIYNWYSEFKKFAPDINIKLVNGDRLDREYILNNNKYDVLITTYNLLRRDIELYSKYEFTYCILDEAQNIKNAASLNAKATKLINAKCKFALTGTPIENSLMELWSIFDFIMPGFLYDEKRFTTRYHRRLEEDDCIIDELNSLIRPFILRRYKKDVIKELPDKIEKKLVIPMTKEQLEVYDTYNKHVKSIIEKKVKDQEFNTSRIEILSYITKLRQIALDPSVVMEGYNGTSGKLEALLETVKLGIEEGHKILVFSQFTSVLKNIAVEFENNKITYNYLDGSVSSKDRMKLVEEFNNSETSVFLISLKAGGTGLNLTSADIVIHFDPWWNPAVEDQATDRAHRIGQKNIVEVIKMVSEGTVEEKILMLQEEKKNLIKKVIDEENRNIDIISSLNEDEILNLLMR